MATILSEKTLTVNEFLELPENRRDRMLIRGELWDKPMTYRNAFHSAVMMQLGHLLLIWLESRLDLNIKVVGGEAGFLLRKDPGSIVGIDVAVTQPDQPKYAHKNRVIFEGPPLLAAEILSPSDRQREIESKVDEYLAVSVPLVWILDPHFRTVTIHRPSQPPKMMSDSDELTGEGILPEFSIPVRKIFETM